MISHDHRVVFVHIPKTAGTSVEAAFGLHGPTGEAVWGAQDHRSVRQLTWNHHRANLLPRSVDDAAEVLRGLRAAVTRRPPVTRVTRAQYAAYLSFAIVRNPWDRAWSWYRNVTTDPAQAARLGVPTGQPFATFLREQIGKDCLRPQTWWLYDTRHRIGVDMVCRFESLDRDWERVCDTAGLGDLALPRVNEGGGAHPAAPPYDDETRALVAEGFGEEIERFGYRFDSATVAQWDMA